MFNVVLMILFTTVVLSPDIRHYKLLVSSTDSYLDHCSVSYRFRLKGAAGPVRQREVGLGHRLSSLICQSQGSIEVFYQKCCLVFMQRRDGAAQSGRGEARRRLSAPGGGRGVGRQDQLPGWRAKC